MPLHPEVGDYKMEATGWLLPRATEALARTNRTAAIFQMQKNQTSPQMLINEFRFAAAKSIRTSTIVLATFNAIAAFATVLGILWDNYSREKKNRGYSIRRDGLNFVAAPDVYPLFVSFGIMIQGIIFAAAQGHGLDGLFTTGCDSIAQSMLPALILVPAVQVIFGMETTLRGLRGKPFPPRGPWAVRVCLILVGAAFLASFVVAYVNKPPPFCFANLFWFVANYSLGCFVVLLLASVILTVSTLAIFLKLSRTVAVGPTERVGASRTVYYLALAMISNTLLLPFFFHMAFYDQRDPRFQGMTLSVVASVVAEVSGVVTGGLYLFLRSSTAASIGPKHKYGDDDHKSLKHSIRRGPNSSGGAGDQGITSPNGLRRMDSDLSMYSRHEKDVEASMDTKDVIDPLRSHATYPQPRPPLQPPQPLYLAPPTSRAESRTKSVSSVFSVFRPKSTRQSSAVTLLPATTYSPNGGNTTNASTAVKPHRFDFSTLKPPPSMRPLGGSRHRRDSSIASHITVQLALRLSNLGDIPPMASRQSMDSNVSPIEVIPVMNQTGLGPQSRPAPKPSPLSKALYVPPEADAAIDADKLSLADDVRPLVPQPLQTARMEEQQVLTLSPTVYSPSGGSPTSKMVSPRGVGFSPVARNNSTSQSSVKSQGSVRNQRKGDQRAPPPRKASAASVKPPPTTGKAGDWI